MYVIENGLGDLMFSFVCGCFVQNFGTNREKDD